MNRAEGSGFAALLEDYRHFAGARLWLALTVMLLGALAEGFGLLMIVPLASIAIGSREAELTRWLPFAANVPAPQRFLLALFLFILAMALRSVLLFVRDRQTARLEADYEASLRLRAAATLANRGWSFAARIGQPGMQSLLLNDVPRAALAVGQMQQFAVFAVLLFVQLVLTAWLSPVLTLIALAILAVGAVTSTSWTRRGVRSGLAIAQSMEESAGSGFRLHAALKAALAQGTVSAFLAEYRVSLRDMARQVVRYAQDYSAARQLGAFGAALAAAVLLFVGIRVLALPIPVLITSLILFARMATPAQALQQTVQQVGAYAPAFGAIEARLGKLEDATTAARPADPVDWQELRLADVRFEHGAGLGVRSISFDLKRGEWLGLSGPSGAGKTTVIDLVSGLLAPEGGAITLDSKPLEGALLERWRSGLAYVGQEAAVFNDSVRANLLAEGSLADEAALWRTLEAVRLAERIRAFPFGLDEDVGDRGSQLSGGERQRLVLARALLRRPSLLILDEATAALDAASEAEVLERVRSLDPRPAVILVAHRESSLAHCDSVVSIQHGKSEKPRD